MKLKEFLLMTSGNVGICMHYADRPSLIIESSYNSSSYIEFTLGKELLDEEIEMIDVHEHDEYLTVYLKEH